jgi:hypothetical protein
MALLPSPFLFLPMYRCIMEAPGHEFVHAGCGKRG